MQRSPTRRNKQLSKAEALSRGVSPTKLEMTGRVGTATKTKKIEPYQPKTVHVRDFNQQNWPTLDNVNVTVGDKKKDQIIQDNIAKNAELEEKIAALKA